MTPEQIAKLEAAEQAATKAPWWTWLTAEDDSGYWSVNYVGDHKYPIHGHIVFGPHEADARFIVLTRNHIADLLAERKRLREALNFRASGPDMDDHDAPALLELVASYMDVRDKMDGNLNNAAQTDLRKWATVLRAALRDQGDAP